MEPATIAVLAFTAAFLGFCIWIERNSRHRQAAPVPEEPEEGTIPAEEKPEMCQLPRRRKRSRS